MNKKMLKTDIKKIKNISSKMPKTINEAINFNEVDDMDYDMMDDESMDNDMGFEDEEPMSTPSNDMNAEELLSDIRKKAINGMAKLADTPEDPNYEMLKKIFLMLDKAVSEKQEQREVMAKNPNARQNM
jgi:hypothetical protein